MNVQPNIGLSSTNDIKYRARAGDPLSSINAAENAALFAGAHKDRIVAALSALGNATAHEVAEATGLTVVQVDRRLPELKRDGAAEVLQLIGEDVMRGGFRVWVLQKNLAAEQQKVADATTA